MILILYEYIMSNNCSYDTIIQSNNHNIYICCDLSYIYNVSGGNTSDHINVVI